MKIKKTNMRYFIRIPDLVSLLNLSFGFLAILMAIINEIAISAIFIIMAGIFDSLDGWTARKVGKTDELGFGKNIDSLSDIVSFGVAPAILLYILGAKCSFELAYIVSIVSLFLVICGVLRLTRFNVIADKTDFKGFIGMPIPATALILSTYVLCGFFNIEIAIVLMLISGILMISNIKYSKPKNMKLIAIYAVFILLILLPFPFVFYGVDVPSAVVLIITLLFMLSGVIKKLIQIMTNSSKHNQ
ncbi:archaetidylserine synthase [Methanobrevibacter filiformis]|uniref:CDP-alcohol phosphatidyltransferase n=1 Tax=Methanobrevibacter filiformis TaxID=55758 RepID=A0A166CXT6_9EURY|nr:archaetidylserine synthase [Methanobrevibacter filiformis]KZX17497.1 CDP-alcohol phosphatidyltransferase [Methanobrevibacter filiformis]